MKKLVILLVLLAAAGTAAWLIYRKTPSGPEDKAVLYGNVDLRQVDLAFLISERIDSVLVDEGDTVVPGQKLATLETVRLRQAADEARQIAEAARQNYLRVKNGPRAEEIAQARANVQAPECAAKGWRRWLKQNPSPARRRTTPSPPGKWPPPIWT